MKMIETIRCHDHGSSYGSNTMRSMLTQFSGSRMGDLQRDFTLFGSLPGNIYNALVPAQERSSCKTMSY